MRSFVDEFLNMRCSGDVLEAVRPLRNPEKEISESMALIHAIRGKLLNGSGGPYTLVDLCAGNALTAIIGAHLFKLREAVAIDKKERKRNGFQLVKGFTYLVEDLFDQGTWDGISKLDNPIIVASHACKELAVKIATECQTRQLPMAMLPCCVARKTFPTEFITESVVKRVGVYSAWLVHIALLAGGTCSTVERCLSPCNGLVERGL